MCQVDDEISFGMIEAISHLIHRDYEAIVNDFVTLQFISKGTDLRPILPVLANVFDQALEGGGAKNINFQGVLLTREAPIHRMNVPSRCLIRARLPSSHDP
jgi:predicted unusual protein kinase regulating ubiquinone biosynthesis (AarF/ABC1/UbiB family)